MPLAMKWGGKLRLLKVNYYYTVAKGAATLYSFPFCHLVEKKDASFLTQKASATFGVQNEK